MARSTEDTTTQKPITPSRERKRTRWQTSRKRQRKSKKFGGRILPTIWLYTMAAVFGITNLGGDSTRHESEDHPTVNFEAGRRCHQWTACPPQELGTRIKPGGRSLSCQMFGDRTTGHQTGKSTIGSLRKICCQAQGGTGAAQCRLGEISKASGGIPTTKDQIHGPEDDSRGATKGRRICSSPRSTKGSSCQCQQVTIGRIPSATQAHGTSPRRSSYGGNTTEKSGRGGGRGRQGAQEIEVSHPHCRISQKRAEYGKDGFLIGRHDSCHNVHARRPRFFCLVEVMLIDEDSAPVKIGTSTASWRDLATIDMYQIIPGTSSFLDSCHSYGPRQAEYVAQLMRYDVETGLCNEAFDHCLWDETMNDLFYLDQIESASSSSERDFGIPQNQLVRQIEGSTLWTLMAMDDENPHIGSIGWQGAPFQQGHLSQLLEGEAHRFLTSLNHDCQAAHDILAQNPLLSMDEIVVFSYGFFEVYQGKRTDQIPIWQLNQWQQIVKRTWSDFGSEEAITLHVTFPQPLDFMLLSGLRQTLLIVISFLWTKSMNPHMNGMTGRLLHSLHSLMAMSSCLHQVLT